MVDESRENVLSGDAGDAESVGGFSLPDVEGSVLRGGEVDGSSRFRGACPSDDEGFGRRCGDRGGDLRGVGARPVSRAHRQAAFSRRQCVHNQ